VPPSACAAPAKAHDANAATQTLVLTFIAASIPKLLDYDCASETNPNARSGLTRSTLAIGEVLTIQSGPRGPSAPSGGAEIGRKPASNRRCRGGTAIFLGEDPTRPVSSPRVKRPVLAFAPCLSLTLLSCLSLSLSLSQVVGCADESAPITGLTFDACAPLDIGIAPALTAEQMQGVTDALAMWNQAAGTALAPVTMVEGASSTAFATPTPMVPLTFQVAAAPFHGLYDDGAARIYVNEDLTDVGPLRITIAHEIGHAFGLPHVSASVRRSLMNTGNTTVGITAEDVDALAAIWGRCPPAATSSP